MVDIEKICQGGQDSLDKMYMDWPAFQSACLYKEELMVRLLSLFLQQAPGWVDELKSSVSNGDCAAVRKICHTVKGAVAAIRADACYAVIDRLHHLARSDEDSLSGSDIALDHIVVVFNQTKVVSQQIIDQLSGGSNIASRTK